MKYFYSSPSSAEKMLFELGCKNFLLSFAVDAKQCDKFNDGSNSIIIDSGAFSVWNKGGTIDIDKYKDFCTQKPKEWTYISLDVIPKTGSSKAEKNICVEQGFENYLYLKQHIKNLMPVFHYGDDIKWLKKYMDHTDYIGISPANDTHENIKREFLKECFAITRQEVKTHGLGYSSETGLQLFPFYSIDSISWKRYAIATQGKNISLLRSSVFAYLERQRIKQFINLEKEITELWTRRGVVWEK